MGDGCMKKMPGDVVISILLRLPVKSLIRFKFISKTWYALINSSTFIDLHLNRNTTTKDEFVLFKRSFKEGPGQFKNILSFLSCDNDNNLNPIFPDLEAPYFTSTYGCLCYDVVGPCNGLIALTDFEAIVLFNPATKDYRLLPPSPFVCPQGFRRNNTGGVGFGFDSIANDYKVVTITEVFKDTLYWDPESFEKKVEVYDLHINRWRELYYVTQQLPYINWFPGFEKLHQGAFHWYAREDTLIILCFDMRTEIFRFMKMPNSCHDYDGKSYGLAILNRFLTLICYLDPTTMIDPTKDSIDIWVMKVYGVNDSWIKKYAITPLPIQSPLTVWKDHLLIFQSKNGLLVSYDLSSNEVKEFNLHGRPKSLRVIVYKESLNAIPEEDTSMTHKLKCFEKWKTAEH